MTDRINRLIMCFYSKRTNIQYSYSGISKKIKQPGFDTPDVSVSIQHWQSHESEVESPLLFVIAKRIN